MQETTTRGRMAKDSISHARTQKIMDMMRNFAAKTGPQCTHCDSMVIRDLLAFRKSQKDFLAQAKRLLTVKPRSPRVKMPIDMPMRCTRHSNTPVPWRKRQAVPGNSLVQATKNVTGRPSTMSRISTPRNTLLVHARRKKAAKQKVH